MDEKEIWETPMFEPLTVDGVRADETDVSVRNGGGLTSFTVG